MRRCMERGWELESSGGGRVRLWGCTTLTAHCSNSVDDRFTMSHSVVVKGIDEVSGVVEGLGPRAHVSLVLGQPQAQRQVRLGTRV